MYCMCVVSVLMCTCHLGLLYCSFSFMLFYFIFTSVWFIHSDSILCEDGFSVFSISPESLCVL